MARVAVVERFSRDHCGAKRDRSDAAVIAASTATAIELGNKPDFTNDGYFLRLLLEVISVTRKIGRSNDPNTITVPDLFAVRKGMRKLPQFHIGFGDNKL